jgi:hypothetical protein
LQSGSTACQKLIICGNVMECKSCFTQPKLITGSGRKRLL